MSDSDDYEEVDSPPSINGGLPPPVPTSPRPALFSSISGYQSLPHPRRAHIVNTEENPQLTKSLSLEDDRSAEASPPSHSEEEPESMKLGDLVSRHGSSLPLHVRVESGYCGNELQYVISAGDEFFIHLVKQRKVVTLTDSNCCNYTIPSNTPVQIAPLYNPNDNIDEALKGFTFDSVADITSLHTLPKLLRVTKSFHGSDSKCSVEEGELLVVKKISRTPMMRKLVLKVYSVTANEVKVLNEDCVGQFTTNPKEARFLLMQAIQRIPDPFPMEAELYMSVVTPELPLHLSSKVVTLTHCSIETFLVATTYCEDNTTPSEEDEVPVEIPIHIDIEVSVVPSQGTRDKQLLGKKENLYEDRGANSAFKPVVQKANNYSERKPVAKPRSSHSPRLPPSPKHTSLEKTAPMQVPKPRISQTSGPPLLPELGRSSSVEMTSSLQKQVPKPMGVQASGPPLLPVLGRSSSVEMSLPLQMQVPKTRASQSPVTPPLPKPRPSSAEKTAQLQREVHGNSTDSNQQLSALQSSTQSLKTMMDTLQANSEEQFSRIKAELARIAPIIDNLSKQCISNMKRLEQLKEVVDTLEQKQHRPENASAKEGNNIKSLTHNQVLALLAAMNLHQYQATFRSEVVDGEILSECDDGVLENELGITSRLHRLRLLKIISGETSLAQFL